MVEPSREESARAWFETAREDEEAADVLLKADPPKNVPAAFHCQQAAEKYLKGFLAYHGGDPPYTHDLEQLLRLSREHEAALHVLHDAAKQLYPFAVEVRYPFGFSVSEKEAVDALKQARHIRDTILACVDL